MRSKLISISLCVLSTAVCAQDRPAPTETDLKANYCVAVVQDSVASLERVKHDPAKPFKSEDEKKLSAALDAGLANAQTDLRRLHTYLAGRLKQVEVAPMGAAKLQAENDIKAVQSERARCASQCSPSATPASGGSATPDRSGRTTCLNTCYSGIALASKMKTCSPTDWLPH